MMKLTCEVEVHYSRAAQNDGRQNERVNLSHCRKLEEPTGGTTGGRIVKFLHFIELEIQSNPDDT